MEALTRDEALAVLEAHRADVQAFGVRSLYLFGSVVRGEARIDSDVDLLVEFDGAPTFERYMDLRFYLEDLFGRRVDLVIRDDARPRLRPIIEREAVRAA